MHSLDEDQQTVPVDVPDGRAVFQVWGSEIDRSQQYLEEYIAAHNRKMRTYLRFSNPDMVEINDAKIIVTFDLYKVGALFSSSFLEKLRLWTGHKYQED